MQVQITARCLKDQGKSIKEITRDLGLSRNTVRRYLRDRAASGCPVRPAKPNARLEPFAQGIGAMVAEGLFGSGFLTELRERGCCGPRGIFYRYLWQRRALA